MMRVFVAPSSSSWACYPVGEHREVTRVDPHGAEVGTGDLDAEAHGLGDVEGVDEQGGALAERVHLGAEGVGLGVAQEHERSALVPAVGMPYSECSARRLEVAVNPATYAARAAATAAHSWVRREPISMTGRSPAAHVIREAAEAIAESWL